MFNKGNDVGLRGPFFLLMSEIMVELKTTILKGIHQAQAMNYLEAYNFTTGLLIAVVQRASSSKEFSTNLGNQSFY